MLDAYLRILKDNEVQEFVGMGICVRFFAEVPELSDTPEVKKTPNSMWENERLWPGGRPPEFQRKDK